MTTSSYKDLDIKFKEALRDLRHLALEEGAENSRAEELSFKVEEAHRACGLWDDTEWDATDFAHPAWWRGQDHAVVVMSTQLWEALGEAVPEYKDPGDLWHQLLERVKQLKGK